MEITSLLYTEELVLRDKLEQDLKHFAEVCRRKGLKINAGKRKVMVLGGKKRLV